MAKQASDIQRVELKMDNVDESKYDELYSTVENEVNQLRDGNACATPRDPTSLDERRSDDDRVKVWDRICLGTDYDGLIDPFNPYPTALSLDRFADDLREQLAKVSHTRMIEAIGVDELVEKICWKNAYEFTRRVLPAATR